jgi:hypothetical protein
MTGFPAVSLPAAAAAKKRSLPAAAKLPQPVATARLSAAAGDFYPALGRRQGKTAPGASAADAGRGARPRDAGRGEGGDAVKRWLRIGRTLRGLGLPAMLLAALAGTAAAQSASGFVAAEAAPAGATFRTPHRLIGAAPMAVSPPAGFAPAPLGAAPPAAERTEGRPGHPPTVSMPPPGIFETGSHRYLRPSDQGAVWRCG